MIETYLHDSQGNYYSIVSSTKACPYVIKSNDLGLQKTGLNMIYGNVVSLTGW